MTNTQYRYLIYGTLVLTLVVIALGAFTRLTEAGLGCPDWPGCYGTLTVPNSQADFARAEQLFPDSPVEIDKAWNEMIHRYIAGTLGLLVLAINIGSWQQVSRPKKLPLLLLAVVCFQAALGMWTVTMNLMPVVVMGHLLGGFTTASLLLLLSLRVHRQAKQIHAFMKMKPSLSAESAEAIFDDNAKPLSSASSASLSRSSSSVAPPLSKGLLGLVVVALVVVIGQIMLGGWTAANYAAVVCTQLPVCEVDWLANYDVSAFAPIQAVHDSYQYGVLDYSQRVTIHVTHRLGAVVVVAVLAVLIWQLLSRRAYQGYGWLITGVLMLQILLGLTNVVAHLPLGIAVAHNLVGALLLLSLVATSYRLVSDYQQQMLSLAQMDSKEEAWQAKEQQHGEI
ncbi:cytochrome B [Photobacterium jeanii]|uniref:Cytochrome B n=1 Tax=Photobacterium jeanii TaxID=858640 RepID=A0A178KI28_9GAMM|nr:COX15/CtaA family protein [Photobacterium jeanii]OAN16968.1 cytochrome B [Photobacterium jeanii]PST88258.1 heme A synthase [Photobacterium jeanii]